MAFKKVYKTLKNRLSCASCDPNTPVILCVREELIAPKVCYPDPLADPLVTEGTSHIFHTITGALVTEQRIKDTFGRCAYQYEFTYDDLQLVPDTSLASADILGVFCDGCLAQYMRDLAGVGVQVALVPATESEPAKVRLINQFGCIYEWNQASTGETFEETPNTVTDSSTIDFTATGSLNRDITGTVKLDGTVGNLLYVAAGGLRLDCAAIFAGGCGAGGEIENTVIDTSTINFSTSGTLQRTITGSVKVSVSGGNQLSVNGDGLFVPTPVETANTAVDSNSIDVAATGTLGRAIGAALKVSATANNAVTVLGDGVFVQAETANTVVDTSTIDFAASGTLNRTITGAVKVPAGGGQAIVVGGSGLFVETKSAAEANTATAVAAPINISSGGPTAYGQTGAITLTNPSANVPMKYFALFTFLSQTVMSGPGPTAVWTHTGEIRVNSGSWTPVTVLGYGSFPTGPVGMPWFSTYSASGEIPAGGTLTLEARQVFTVASGIGTGSSITSGSTGIRAIGANV